MTVVSERALSLLQAQNAEGYAWKGVLAGGVGAAAELFSSNGEVSIAPPPPFPLPLRISLPYCCL